MSLICAFYDDIRLPDIELEQRWKEQTNNCAKSNGKEDTTWKSEAKDTTQGDSWACYSEGYCQLHSLYEREVGRAHGPIHWQEMVMNMNRVATSREEEKFTKPDPFRCRIDDIAVAAGVQTWSKLSLQRASCAGINRRRATSDYKWSIQPNN